MRPKCRCRPPLTAPVRTPIVGIRVNCFSVRCPLSPHDNCFTYFTFGFGAAGHIHRTQDNWQLCFYGKNFASGNKRWLRVTSGRGKEAGFGNTFVFSPTVSPICGAVNLGNQSWGNTSKHIYENFGFGVSGRGMWRFSGWNYGCKCIHHPGGPEALPPPE